MKKKYTFKNLVILCLSFVVLTAVSCKKKEAAVNNGPTVATPTKLGLYEYGENDTSYFFRELDIPVTKVGTQSVTYGLVFDTGSGGMVIDASGILPASMITTSGFKFTGDSTIVNGITITNQTDTIEYGDDATVDKVFGNLAYAPVTVGDVNGNITVTRLPFFIYYKAVDNKGNSYDPHEFDVFGALEQYDITFANNAYITSPFSYYTPGTGLTKGFKMAALGTSNFSANNTFVPGVITLGLTTADLSSSSGFTMANEISDTGFGYVPFLQFAITYGGKSVTSYSLFDTGTDPYNYIEDKNAPTTVALLPSSTSVSATYSGFNYSYTTAPADNLTYLENPSVSMNIVSIFGLQFFLNNEFLLDYTDHKLGLKSN